MTTEALQKYDEKQFQALPNDNVFTDFELEPETLLTDDICHALMNANMISMNAGHPFLDK